jgi:HAE1 family hydrophobic/amphiphilic exporter-1
MAEFFIRRPIVAIVMSILIVLVGLNALRGLSVEQYPFLAPPTIRITANYPGRAAVAVEQSVATPIEQEVNGVEGMIYMKSSNTSDGRMQLDVNFMVGTDQDMANVLTQNRVSTAQSRLPQEVTQQGVTVKKQSPSILMLISLYSPDGTYDANFLINYAGINIRDQLLRIPASRRSISSVAPTTACASGCARQAGAARYHAERCHEGHQGTEPAGAVGRVGMRPSPADQEFTYTVSAPGRLVTAEEFGNIIIRETRTAGRSASRTSARRARLAGLQLVRPPRRQAGRRAGVYLQPGANQLAAAKGIYETMKLSHTFFPATWTTRSSTTRRRRSKPRSSRSCTRSSRRCAGHDRRVRVPAELRATLIPLLTVPVR